MRLHLHQGRALTLVLLEDAASPHVHTGVNTAHCLFGASDFDKEDGLLQGRVRSHLRSEAAAARRRHNLPSTAMDRIRVQRHIHEVEADTTHRLLAERALLSCPLEAADNMFL